MKDAIIKVVRNAHNPELIGILINDMLVSIPMKAGPWETIHEIPISAASAIARLQTFPEPSAADGWGTP